MALLSAAEVLLTFLHTGVSFGIMNVPPMLGS